MRPTQTSFTDREGYRTRPGTPRTSSSMSTLHWTRRAGRCVSAGSCPGCAGLESHVLALFMFAGLTAQANVNKASKPMGRPANPWEGQQTGCKASEPMSGAGHVPPGTGRGSRRWNRRAKRGQAPVDCALSGILSSRRDRTNRPPRSGWPLRSCCRLVCRRQRTSRRPAPGRS